MGKEKGGAQAPLSKTLLPKTHILVIGFNDNFNWAKRPIPQAEEDDKLGIKAETKAMHAARKAARNPKSYAAYRVTEGTTVSNCGDILYPGDSELDKPVLLVIRFRR